MEPRGSINLVTRAPIDITYSHTIDFTSPNEQLAYWGSKVKYRLENYSYIRRERRYINIDKTYEELDGVNYLFYQARENSKYYFCFVTEREYINEKATRIYFEVDVLQTFMFDYTWKPSYIAQGHVDRWDKNHKPKYSYTDEGLDYGSEYVTENAYKIEPKSDIPHGFYLVYTVNHSKFIDSGSASDSTIVEGAPIPYDVYIVPEFRGGYADNEVCYMGLSIESDLKGCATIIGFLKFMSRSAFGNYVKQIAYIPYLPLPYKIFAKDENPLNGACISFEMSHLEGMTVETTTLRQPAITDKSDSDYNNGLSGATVTLLKLNKFSSPYFNRDLAEADTFIGLEGVMPTSEMWRDILGHPMLTERDRRFESKLLTFPYRYNLFTDWTNAPLIIKNEFLCGEKITVKESFSAGFNIPRRYYVKNYRKDSEGRECSLTQPIPLEAPILTDQYYTYLLENKNQINANMSNATINAIYGAVTGAVGGGVTGATYGMAAGPAGMMVGAIGGAVVGGASKAVGGIISVSNMIRSENAKQSDIKSLPDSVITSNDSSFAISDNRTYLTFYRKAISCDYQERLAQYWHMFGYIVKALDVPNTRSRVRFNYIRTVGANIEGDIESNYLTQIKGIFDNGITIWHYAFLLFCAIPCTKRPQSSACLHP